MGKMRVWSPFRDMWDLKDEIDKVFWGTRKGSDSDETATWQPLVDIYEDKDNVKVTAELPGMTKGDVKITIDNNVLTIKGERKFEQKDNKDNYYRIERSYGSFARSFGLPTNLSPERIHAEMKEGVLEIKIPKREESKPKEIEIK